MYSSLRPKRRYVYVEVSNGQDAKKLIPEFKKFLLSFFGELLFSDLYFNVVSCKHDVIIFSVKREHIKVFLASLSLFSVDDARFVAKFVSGTLKRLRRKINANGKNI